MQVFRYFPSGASFFFLFVLNIRTVVHSIRKSRLKKFIHHMQREGMRFFTDFFQWELLPHFWPAPAKTLPPGVPLSWWHKILQCPNGTIHCDFGTLNDTSNMLSTCSTCGVLKIRTLSLISEVLWMFTWLGQNMLLYVWISNAEGVCSKSLYWRTSYQEKCGDIAHLKYREALLNGDIICLKPKTCRFGGWFFSLKGGRQG